jgi:hypothetical protein
MTTSQNHRTSLFVVSYHIVVFFCFAIAQPTFDLLGNYPEFFIAQALDEIDLLLLAVILTYLLPLPFIGILVLANSSSLNGFRVILALLLFVLAGLLFLPVVKQTGFSDLAVVLICAVLAVAATVLYFRSQIVQGFSSILGLMLIVSPIYFLFFSPVSELMKEPESMVETNFTSASNVPIVVLIFDEFPLSAIMDEQHGIDRVNFPNFARLADMSYWFRNATTVAASTVLAVPAIMTGNYPRKFSTPILSAYPDSIFTLLANSHAMNVKEGPTRLCPGSVCSDTKWALPRSMRMSDLLADVAVIYGHFILPLSFSRSLPSIGDTWKDFGSNSSKEATLRLSDARLFERFVEDIRPGNPEGLHLIHTELPHIPYEYLPSGKRYSGGSVLPGKTGEFWGGDAVLINQAYQRLLLQLGAADKMIGILLDKLVATNMLNETILVVTADHGAAFVLNRNRREDLRNKILQSSIMPVPLFVKKPGQVEGKVDDRNAEVIDILPTIVELADLETSLQFDGQNLIGGNWKERENKKFLRGLRKMWVFEAAPQLDYKNAIISWKYNNFYDSQRLKLSLYDKGPNPELIMKPVADLNGFVASENSYSLDESVSLEVNENSDFIPAHLFGRVDIDPGLAPVDLAFSINGVVQATSHSYVVDDIHHFSAMVPERAFNHGGNEVGIFSVQKFEGGIQLQPLTNKAARLDQYRLVKDASDAWVIANSDTDNAKADDDQLFDARVKTTIEGRDTIRFITEIYTKNDASTQFEILVFDGQECIYKVELFTKTKGKYASSFVLPTSKFEKFGKLPIRIYASDSNGMSRELSYYVGYPYH